MSRDLPQLPEVAAMAAAIEHAGIPPEIARRRAIRQLNALFDLGWGLERTPEGEARERRRENLRMAEQARAEGDEEDALFFLAKAPPVGAA